MLQLRVDDSTYRCTVYSLFARRERAAQETTDARWTQAIKKVADSKIRVSRFQGASVTGAFVSATSDDITLRTKQAVTTIKRSEIRKIQRLGGVARLKKAAVGGVAGGGVGALIF